MLVPSLAAWWEAWQVSGAAGASPWGSLLTGRRAACLPGCSLAAGRRLHHQASSPLLLPGPCPAAVAAVAGALLYWRKRRPVATAPTSTDSKLESGLASADSGRPGGGGGSGLTADDLLRQKAAAAAKSSGSAEPGIAAAWQ